MLKILIVMVVGALPVSAFAESAAVPEASKELYITKCASCHTVGEGDRIGPDLKGVTGRRDPGWLARMITAPSSMLDSDADARALLSQYNNVRMPDLGLDARQVDALVALLDYCSNNTCDLTPKLTPVTEATPGDVAHGRELFLGTTRLENEGPPCISCHSVEGAGSILGGGQLSVDLTHTFARLGDAGLEASLRNPTFKLMNRVFGDHPLTAQESFALRAFFYDANRGALVAPDGESGSFSVPLAGVLGTILAIILLNAAWPRRLKGVREPLVRRRKERLS